MAYVPQNQTLFNAVYGAALAGMTQSQGPWIPKPNPADYNDIAATAGAFAQKFDTLWGTALLTDLNLNSAVLAVEAFWETVPPPSELPGRTDPNTYTTTATALIAEVQSGTNYVVGQGITPTIIPNAAAALAQGNWFIDPINGLDTNPGTQLLPIKTNAQLSARLGKGNFLPGVLSVLITPIQRIVVTYTSDVPNSDPLDLECVLPPNCLLAFIGLATTIRTGTLTAVTTKAPATNIPWEFTDAVVPFTAADVGRRIILTSGASSGTFGWVAKHTAGVLRMSNMSTPTMPGNPDVLIQTGTTNAGVIAAPDAYTVQSLLKMTIRNLNVRSPLGGTGTQTVVGFANFEFQNPGGAFAITPFVPNTTALVLKGCRFTGAFWLGLNIFRAVVLNCCSSNAVTALAPSGNIAVHAGLCLGPVQNRNFGVANYDFDFMVQGAPFTDQTNGVQFGAVCVFDSPVEGFGIGQLTPHGTVCQTAFSGAHRMWGSGNVASGVKVYGGSVLTYQTTVPTVVGATDFNLAGNATSSSFDNVTGFISAPTIANTWTNFPVAAPAGFGGNAHNFERSAHIGIRG